MNETHIYLRNGVSNIKERHPNSEWYIFGSFSRSDERFTDIDILVISDDKNIRRECKKNLLNIYFHLTICTREEERELSFIEEQNCIRIA